MKRPKWAPPFRVVCRESDDETNGVVESIVDDRGNELIGPVATYCGDSWLNIEKEDAEDLAAALNAAAQPTIPGDVLTWVRSAIDKMDLEGFDESAAEGHALLQKYEQHLPAAAQRDERDELLREAVAAVKRYRALFGSGPYANDLGAKQERDDLDAIIADFEALNKEEGNGVPN